MQARYRKATLFAVLAAVVAFIVADRASERDARPAASRASPQPQGRDEARSAPASEAKIAHAPPLALPERASLGAPAGELFGSQSWRPQPPAVAGPPHKPVPPPMPYRFAGRLVQDGQVQIFLSKGDRPVPIKPGAVLDGAYRVDSIAESGVTLTYLPLGHTETIPIRGTLPATVAAARGSGAVASSSGGQPGGAGNPFAAVLANALKSPLPLRGAAPPAAEPKGAKLLWEGPQEVKLGASFSVVLRVVSDEPVRASPMEVRFDPSVLETIAVQPGKFYAAEAARRFSYRINPDGAIIVGASNPSAVPAPEMELLVLTFKPVKSSTSAELSIASLTLEGAGGRAIALDQRAAFKATVIP